MNTNISTTEKKTVILFLVVSLLVIIEILQRQYFPLPASTLPWQYVFSMVLLVGVILVQRKIWASSRQSIANRGRALFVAPTWLARGAREFSEVASPLARVVDIAFPETKHNWSNAALFTPQSSASRQTRVGIETVAVGVFHGFTENDPRSPIGFAWLLVHVDFRSSADTARLRSLLTGDQVALFDIDSPKVEQVRVQPSELQSLSQIRRAWERYAGWKNACRVIIQHNQLLAVFPLREGSMSTDIERWLQETEEFLIDLSKE